MSKQRRDDGPLHFCLVCQETTERPHSYAGVRFFDAETREQEGAAGGDVCGACLATLKAQGWAPAKGDQIAQLIK